MNKSYFYKYFLVFSVRFSTSDGFKKINKLYYVSLYD